VLKILLALLALILAAYAEEPLLRTLAAVRAISHEEAAKSLLVEIEGTVIFADSKDPGIIVHDETACQRVWGESAISRRPEIRLQIPCYGQDELEFHFPDVAVVKAAVLGHGDLPEPRHATGRDLFSPLLVSPWIEIEAVVIGTEEGWLAFTLVLDIDGRHPIYRPPVRPNGSFRGHHPKSNFFGASQSPERRGWRS
jgi:hypothetical protein